MASRNSKPRTNSRPEQGAAAQEERNMWEIIKADMLRAHGLKKQSDDLFKLVNDAKAKVGGDWKSRFDPVLYIPPVSHSFHAFKATSLEMFSFSLAAEFLLHLEIFLKILLASTPICWITTR